MTIEQLVPSLEVCKTIPAGRYDDSCFVWTYSCNTADDRPYIAFREDVELTRKGMVNAPPIYPAPTMGEIFNKITGNYWVKNEKNS